MTGNGVHEANPIISCRVHQAILIDKSQTIAPQRPPQSLLSYPPGTQCPFLHLSGTVPHRNPLRDHGVKVISHPPHCYTGNERASSPFFEREPLAFDSQEDINGNCAYLDPQQICYRVRFHTRPLLTAGPEVVSAQVRLAYFPCRGGGVGFQVLRHPGVGCDDLWGRFWFGWGGRIRL